MPLPSPGWPEANGWLAWGPEAQSVCLRVEHPFMRCYSCSMLPVWSGWGPTSDETTSSLDCCPDFPLGFSWERPLHKSLGRESLSQALLSGNLSECPRGKRLGLSFTWQKMRELDPLSLMGLFHEYRWQFPSNFVYFISIFFPFLCLLKGGQYPLSSTFWTLKCFSARESRGRSQGVPPGPQEMLVTKGLSLGVGYATFSLRLSFVTSTTAGIFLALRGISQAQPGCNPQGNL